jgi:hypothetical protein
MILDERTEFADAAAIALAIGNAKMPNSDEIDLGAVPTLRAIDVSSQMYLVLSVDTAFVGATATIQLELASDSTANLATSRTTHINTGAIPVASFSTGAMFIYALPPGANFERYLGLWMTVATANVTAGNLSAYLTMTPPVATIYPDAIN